MNRAATPKTPNEPRRQSVTSVLSSSNVDQSNDGARAVVHSTSLVNQLATKLEQAHRSAEFAQQALQQCRSQDKTLLDSCNFEEEQIARLVLELNSLRSECTAIKRGVKRSRMLQAAILTGEIETERQKATELRGLIAVAQRDYADLLTERFAAEQELRLHDNTAAATTSTSLAVLLGRSEAEAAQRDTDIDSGLNGSALQAGVLSNDNVLHAFLPGPKQRQLAEDRISQYLQGAERLPDADSRDLRQLGEYLKSAKRNAAATPTPTVFPEDNERRNSSVPRLPILVTPQPHRSRSALL
jgi:hypothetical protein